MFESFGRSYQLVKESFNVLKKDKELALLPVISGIVSLALIISFIVPIFLVGQNLNQASSWVLMFLFYLLSYFIVIFFNTALIAGAYDRLQGNDPTLRSALGKAFKHISSIFIWALISASVGIILQTIAERSRLLGRIIVAILGTAWSLLTYFVVPVLVFENQGVFSAISRSGSLFKQTWGEQVIGRMGMSAFFGLLFLVGLVIGVIAVVLVPSLFILVVILAIIYFIALGIVSATLEGIYTAALYQYASTGRFPSDFSKESIDSAFKQKR